MKPKERLKNAFSESLKPLMGLGAELLQDPTQADAFRVKMIQDIMKDIANMRDALADTYDMPWKEYQTKFLEKLAELMAENPPLKGEKEE